MQVREPIEVVGDELRAALDAVGLVVVGPADPTADVLVWAVEAVGGVDAVRAAAVPVLALVDRPLPALVAELQAAGASGVLPRDAEPRTIAGAALAVAGGAVVLPASSGCRAAWDDGEPLTDLELAWMRALARGVPVGGLADREGYSERAMYRKLRDTYRKLRVPGRTEALVALARANLLDVG